MFRYRITLLVPTTKEVLCMNIEEAGKEAKRLAKLHNNKDTEIVTVVRSIFYVQDEPEPVDFGFAEATG